MRLTRQQTALKMFSEGLYVCKDDAQIITDKYGTALTQRRMHNGYLQVGLWDGQYKWRFTVHSLMWLFFNGDYAEGLQINHKDGKKDNNVLSNLELVTPKENGEHASRLGLLRPAKGEDAYFSSISEREVKEMRYLHLYGVKACELSRIYNLSESGVSNILRYKSWKELPEISPSEIRFLKENGSSVTERNKTPRRSLQGSEHGRALVTEPQVREIRRLYGEGTHSYVSLGLMFGVDKSSIASIVKRKNWKHVS